MGHRDWSMKGRGLHGPGGWGRRPGRGLSTMQCSECGQRSRGPEESVGAGVTPNLNFQNVLGTFQFPESAFVRTNL